MQTMKTSVLKITGLLFVCVLAAAAADSNENAGKGFESMGGPYPDDPRHVHHYRLDNGLEVFLSACVDEPRFYAEIAVRAGSKNDPPDATGLAHYMEHLLFKGSEKLGTLDYEKEKPHLERVSELYEQHFNATDPAERKAIYQQITEESTRAAAYSVPNELDRTYSALGARNLNAHTWVEEVVYKVDLPKNCLEQWAMIESDRFLHPVFRLFQTELETVYEEMNRAQDNKNRIISEAVAACAFKNHPYGQQTTLGKVEHLKSPSIRKLEEFYRTWYVPNNMAIFIAGDIDPDETMEIINRYFSSWEPRPIPEQKQWQEDPLRGREQVTVSYEGEEFVLLGFRTVPFLHPDRLPLLMLDMMLDNSEAGLINLNLNKNQRVQSAGAYPMIFNDYGMQYLYGTPKEGQSKEEVEALLLEQLRIIRAGEFDDWLIPAINNYFQKSEKAKLEKYSSCVPLMRDAWLAYEPWEDAYRFLDQMAAVTREDVIRVANEYFGENYVAGYREDGSHNPPLVEKPPLPDINIDAAAQSDLAKAVLALPQPDVAPVFLQENRDYRKLQDERGITLYHTPNPYNDLFSLTFSFPLGTRQDKRLAAATNLFSKTGTETKSPDELQIEWFKRGSSFNISASANDVVLIILGLDDQLPATLALLQEMLEHPAVTEESLETMKAVTLKIQADLRKDPGGLMTALSSYMAYGEESAARQWLPADQLKALTAAELQALLRSLFTYKYHVLYSGTMTPEEALRLTGSLCRSDAPLTDRLPYYQPTMRTPEKNEIFFTQREMGQAHITIRYPGVNYDPELMAQVNLFNEYFSGGMSGLVFQELREVRALAYAAYAAYQPGARRTEQNTMEGMIQTQADKAPEAINAFIDLLDNMPLSAERFKQARETLLKDFAFTRTSFREIPALALSWERKQIEPDPREKVYQKIQQMTSIDILATFHKEHIAGKAKLISVLGDTARLDFNALGGIAEVRTLTPDELFIN
jgi:predicted Zn-dependent peptidase